MRRLWKDCRHEPGGMAADKIEGHAIQKPVPLAGVDCDDSLCPGTTARNGDMIRALWKSRANR
jgi:hypothetical protein